MMAWMDANKITSPDARAEILDLGAVEPAELTDLEDEDIAELCDKMKKLEANRFRKAIEGLRGVGGASPGAAATTRAAVVAVTDIIDGGFSNRMHRTSFQRFRNAHALLVASFKR